MSEHNINTLLTLASVDLSKQWITEDLETCSKPKKWFGRWWRRRPPKLEVVSRKLKELVKKLIDNPDDLKRYRVDNGVVKEFSVKLKAFEANHAQYRGFFAHVTTRLDAISSCRPRPSQPLEPLGQKQELPALLERWMMRDGYTEAEVLQRRMPNEHGESDFDAWCEAAKQDKQSGMGVALSNQYRKAVRDKPIEALNSIERGDLEELEKIERVDWMRLSNDIRLAFGERSPATRAAFFVKRPGEERKRTEFRLILLQDMLKSHFTVAEIKLLLTPITWNDCSVSSRFDQMLAQAKEDSAGDEQKLRMNFREQVRMATCELQHLREIVRTAPAEETHGLQQQVRDNPFMHKLLNVYVANKQQLVSLKELDRADLEGTSELRSTASSWEKLRTIRRHGTMDGLSMRM